MVLCNDIHTESGVVWHCRIKANDHAGVDHAAGTGHMTWPAGCTKFGPRWTLRHPNAFLWHAISDRRTTACGSEILGLTASTVRGRTEAKPPADAHVCPLCAEMYL